MEKENNLSVTDKELLAICNLSNLKMEFANIIKEEKEENVRENGKDVKKKIYTNHTIYSLLKAETESIQNNDTDTRVFYKLKENKEKNKIIKKPIYYNKNSLISNAGMVYEYCEKYSMSNEDKEHQGYFTDEWEILYSGDTYKIISTYFDLFQNFLTKVYITENENFKVFFFEKANEKNNENYDNLGFFEEKILTIKVSNNELKEIKKEDIRKITLNKKTNEVSTIQEITDDEFELYLSNQKNMSNMKLYPTREEIENNEKNQKILDALLITVDIASFVIPTLSSYITSGAKVAGKFGTRYGVAFAFFKLRKNVIKAMKNPFNTFICNLSDYYLSVASFNLANRFIKSNSGIEFFHQLMEEIINDYVKTLTSLKNSNIIGSLFFTLPFFTYTQLANVINALKNFLEENMSSIENYEKYNKKLQELENLQLDTSVDVEEFLNISETGFGITILKHKQKKEIVVCFKNPEKDSNTYKNIQTKTLSNEIFMIRFIDRYLLYKICEEANIKKNEYNITLTGFEYGADLADLYYYTCSKEDIIATHYNIKTFKYSYNNLIFQLSRYNLKNLSIYFNKNVESSLNHYVKGLGLFTASNALFIVSSFLLSMPQGVVLLLVSGITFQIFLIYSTFKQYQINKNMKFLYVKICEYNFIECIYRESCKKNSFNKCKFLKYNYTETNDYPLVKNIYTQKELNEYTNIYFEDFNEQKAKLDFKRNNGYKITKKAFLSLLIDITIKEYQNKFSKIEVNSLGEQVFIQNKGKEYQNITYVYSEADLPLKEEKDEYISNLYEAFYESKKDRTFSEWKKIENDIFYYKLYITNDNYIKVKKYNKKIIEYIKTKTIPNNTEYPKVIFKSTREYYKELEEKEVSLDSKELINYLLFTQNINSLLTEKTENCNYMLYNNTIYYSNRLINLKGLSSKQNLLYQLWIYIQDDGNIKIFKKNCNINNNIISGYTLTEFINPKYIGSFFKSALEILFVDMFYNTTNGNNCYKAPVHMIFYDKCDIKQNSFFAISQDKYNNFYPSVHFSIDNDIRNCKNKTEFNILLIKFLNKLYSLLNYEIDESDKSYHEFYFFSEILFLLKYNPNILEQFYIYEKSELYGFYNIIIGHLTNGKYNEKIIEYLYNGNHISRGTIKLVLFMPSFSEEDLNITTIKSILTSGTDIVCSAGVSGIISTNNNIFKINKKNIVTTSDNITGKQLKLFGYCQRKRGLCGGEYIEWNENETIKHGNQKILTTESIGTCKAYGCKISIIKNTNKKAINLGD